MVDGPPTVPGEGAEKGKGRTGPGGAELQSQTGHQHPRSARAAASARPSPRLRTDSTSRQSPPRLSGQKIRDFSHSLAGGYPVRRGVSVLSLSSLQYWVTRIPPSLVELRRT